MILFPAIDLKQGKCVRLYQGDMKQVTVFNNSPAEQAAIFENEGSSWLHMVDLDGAFAGKSENGDSVKAILTTTKLKIQLGGGIRNIGAIENWLKAGVTRVILGTIAVKNPELVRTACKRFPGKIVLGIDAKDGFVATEGWAEKSDVPVIELAQRFEDAGAASIVYTDISKDGAMKGADWEGTKKLAEAVNIPVIISGGISSVVDLKKVKQLESELTKGKIEGVISGRAIYEKAFSVQEAINILK